MYQYISYMTRFKYTMYLNMIKVQNRHAPAVIYALKI